MKNNVQIFDNMSIDEYHSDKWNEYLSASAILIADKSLKEFKYYIDGKLPEKVGSHFDFGNAFEMALLEPEQFKAGGKIAVFDSQKYIDEALKNKPDLKVPTMSKFYKESKELFYEDNVDKYIIEKDGTESFETILQMIESFNSESVSSKLLKNIEKQVSIFWTDKETGLKLKTRPDASKFNKSVLLDIKTTRDGSPHSFCNDVNKLKYWIQALLQIWGCKEAGLINELEAYFWISCEKVIPYNVTIYEFSKKDIIKKEKQLKNLLLKIADAKKTGFYGGYSDESKNEFGILKAKIWD